MVKKFNISFEEVAEVEPVQDESNVELNNQRIELEQDSKETERQGELVEGLEALRYIASKLDTPSPTELALFRVAANMAVAGTDRAAQDFLPAMESNKPIALEGFGTKIMDMIRAIIAKLQEWWKKFKDFIKGLFNKEKIVKAKVIKTSEIIKEKVKEKAEPSSSKITFSTTKPIDNKASIKEEIKPSVEIYVNKLLLSSFYLENKNINLDTINDPINEIDDFSKFAIDTIVPKYIKVVGVILKSIKIKKEKNILTTDSLRDHKVLLESVFKDLLSRSSCITNSSNDVNVLTNRFSISIYSHFDNKNYTNPFVIRTKHDDSLDDKKVSCEKEFKDANELLKEFNSENIKRIQENNELIIQANEKEIEKVNKDIVEFATILAKEIDDGTIDLKAGELLVLTDLNALLNNIQKFSVEAFNIYIESLHQKIKFYDQIVTYYI